MTCKFFQVFFLIKLFDLPYTELKCMKDVLPNHPSKILVLLDM